MSPRIVVVADDLSGAADGATSCAVAGLEAVVVFGDDILLGGDGASAHATADVLAIDADTRARTRAEAATIAGALAGRFAAPATLLFRKIDSTLRGHVAAELAATLAARRAAGATACVALASAFPATGRVVRGGRAFLHGTPLEDTPTWRLEGMAGVADLGVMLRGAGLRAAVVGLAVVRAPGFAAGLRARLAGGSVDVLAFDAECDDDLARIAGALGGGVGCEVIWAGSGGLARHLPAGIGVPVVAPAGLPPADEPAVDGPILFVVGSVASVSRRQAARLGAEPGMRHVPVPVAVLREERHQPDRASLRERIGAALAAGADTLVSLEAGDAPVDLREGRRLATALAALVGDEGHEVGALVATGGETARHVLVRMGTAALRLRGEIEPGVPRSVAVGRRPIPVVTKAGAFGTDDTLVRIRARLREDAHAPHPAGAHARLNRTEEKTT